MNKNIPNVVRMATAVVCDVTGVSSQNEGGAGGKLVKCSSDQLWSRRAPAADKHRYTLCADTFNFILMRIFLDLGFNCNVLIFKLKKIIIPLAFFFPCRFLL